MRRKRQEGKRPEAVLRGMPQNGEKLPVLNMKAIAYYRMIRHPEGTLDDYDDGAAAVESGNIRERPRDWRNGAAMEEEFRDGYVVASRNLEEQKDDFFRRDYDVEKKHMVVLNRGACADPGCGRH
ncbi:hypothetical protein L3476_20785 [Paenibacillus thiaminolyticus]|uniref:hypothetical protein n=1 Tax=Paenibacillus thiaminolyticus TaxID=49283 RepID=UPI0023505F62|nr:hypothetical protein [Paenibacillus thiaminolyticus]WCR30170.1 hypothetical protein L3476_20785 [Paenibacillus thiaminolyticus]